jgi:Immunity protein 35
MRINKDRAEKLVIEHINENYNREKSAAKTELAIRKSIPYEDYGWIFFYDTKKSIETGEWRDGLAGNHPIFVFKDSGEMYSIYPDIELDEIIKKYGKQNSPTGEDFDLSTGTSPQLQHSKTRGSIEEQVPQC